MTQQTPQPPPDSATHEQLLQPHHHQQQQQTPTPDLAGMSATNHTSAVKLALQQPGAAINAAAVNTGTPSATPKHLMPMPPSNAVTPAPQQQQQQISTREIPRSATFHAHAPAALRQPAQQQQQLNSLATPVAPPSASVSSTSSAGMNYMAPPAHSLNASMHQPQPQQPESPPDNGGVNYTSGGAVSITKSYADVSERCYGKVGRWIQKLSAPNVVQEYCLNQSAEIESASKKFLAMCKGLRDAIEYEWIEEYSVNGLDADSAAPTSAADRLTMMQMPAPLKGRQAPLNSAFRIHKLPPLTKNKMPVNSTEHFRICLYCAVPIWNRGWTCTETLAAGSVEVEGHHCCSGCFAEGLVCQSRHTMVMVERYDMQELRKRYRDAVHTYNVILYPTRRMYGNYTANPAGIDLLFTPTKMVIDEYAESDPRPQLGRSEVTVSYHLNIRNICEYPGANCHQCKTKRPSWEIVTCAHPAHVETARANIHNKTKSGYYYCSRCLHNRYNERAINVWGDRSWQCFVCRGMCDCAACNSNATPLAPGVGVATGRTDLVPGTQLSASVLKIRPPSAPSAAPVNGTAHPETAAVSMESEATAPKNRKRKKRKTDTVEPSDAATPNTLANAKATESSQRDDVSSDEDDNGLAVQPGRKSRHSASAASTQQQQQHQHRTPLFAVPSSALSIPDTARPASSSTTMSHTDPSFGEKSAAWLADMSVGRWITELQSKCTQEADRNEQLQREVDELRDMVMSNSSYQDLMRENLQLKMDLSSSKVEIARLNSRLRDLERLYEQSSTVVVPNLKKIAKAIATQASVLSKSIPLSLSEIPPNHPAEPEQRHI